MSPMRQPISFHSRNWTKREFSVTTGGRRCTVKDDRTHHQIWSAPLCPSRDLYMFDSLNQHQDPSDTFTASYARQSLCDEIESTLNDPTAFYGVPQNRVQLHQVKPTCRTCSTRGHDLLSRFERHHNRLGHPSKEATLDILQHYGVPTPRSVPKEHDSCQTCTEGKMKNKAHTQNEGGERSSQGNSFMAT